ncbi:MAG TPA: helix-turn-helix domain-containing protein [Cyclobacteriaceae bacterium]|nr:helix-turn-helix domain-containing protein [Cyclobacteriaceae bacterium]MBX7089940.1 helix-turn-helix domain-containing protein [Cyclobacteriaceae bacterium]HMV07550.1 helix-turn-helix domain-containing protein [Cyclobacteriaceae bacterium]HMV07560.1 helix-turn-helix domain-containing protein [Cyclobacteriaceae bacterium]HMV89050.1 helix-turn-helix domain-containing protein [Cyclobacteriaceae bacterium]
MTENPFETIDGRLIKIEGLLQFLTQSVSIEKDLSARDVGGLEIAVQETGLSTHSIYRLVSERKIPHSKKGGRLYFSRKALQRWIEEGQRSIKK